ncbi:MAG: hypothetical protein RL661_638, partial [Pseudomonadota bacterium]
LREGLIRAESGLGPDSQARLLPATSLLERLIWLTNRYAILLDQQVGMRRAETAEVTH